MRHPLTSIQTTKIITTYHKFGILNAPSIHGKMNFNFLIKFVG